MKNSYKVNQGGNKNNELSGGQLPEKFEFEEGESSSRQHLEKHEPETIGHSLSYKVLKTLAIILVWACIGLWAEGNGSAMPDLIYRTSSNYEKISQAISMRGAGSLAGSVIGGGYLVDRFHSKVEIIMVICLLVCAGLNALVPFLPWVEALYALYVLEGWMEALVNISGHVIIMDIWLERASGPLHAIHLGFGAGGFIAPQILAPFLSENLPQQASTTYSHCRISSSPEPNITAVINNTLNSTDTIRNNSQPSQTLQYGFLIISAIVVAGAAIWIFYAVYDRKKTVSANDTAKKDLPLREIFNLNTCLPGYPTFAFLFYTFLFLWIYVSVAGERIFAKYLYSFARDQACFGKQEAANILTAFWVSFTAGRFLGFVVASFLHMKFIIFIEGFGNLASALVLYFYSSNYYVLWVCACVSGLLIGPCYPSGVSWANRYMIVTATGLTVMSISAGVSDISFLAIVGNYIKNNGLGVMMTFVLIQASCVAVLPFIMQFFARQRGDRFENAKRNGTENDIKSIN